MATLADLWREVVIIGNSITRTTFADDAGVQHDNGMAASAPEKDYVHLLRAKAVADSPTARVRDLSLLNFIPTPGDGQHTPLSYDSGEGSYFETNYWKYDQDPYGFLRYGGVDRYKSLATYSVNSGGNVYSGPPSLFIVRLGENTKPDEHPLDDASSIGLKAQLKKLIRNVVPVGSSGRVIVTTAVWDRDDYNAIVSQLCQQEGFTLCNVSGIAGRTAGAGSHPNDAAHAEIANRIYNTVASLASTSSNTMANTYTEPIIRTHTATGAVDKATVVRNLDTYPKPNTDTQFLAAVNAGYFDITLSSGTVIYATNSQGGNVGTVTTESNTTGGNATLGVNYYFNGSFGEGPISELMKIAPFTPDYTNNRYDADWGFGNGDVRKFVTDGVVKYGISKMGGVITNLYFKQSDGSLSENLINTNTQGYGDRHNNNDAGSGPWPDGGRSGPEFSSYGGPDPYTKNGKSTADAHLNVGFNVVQAGSEFGDYAKVQHYERRNVPGFGIVDYIKTQPYQWGMPNEQGPVIIHQWTWITSYHTVMLLTFVDNQRTDAAGPFEYQFIRPQEWPCTYPIAKLTRYYTITGNSANSPLLDITTTEALVGTDPHYGPEIPSSQGFIFAANNSRKGVGVRNGYNANVVSFKTISEDGNEFSNATGYMNHNVYYNFDEKSTSAYLNEIWVGDLDAFVSYNAAHPMVKVPFDWTFRSGLLCGWTSHNSPAKLNGNNQYQFQFLRPGGAGFGGYFASPWGMYQASDIPTIYIRGVFVGVQQLTLNWHKAGQSVQDQSNSNNGSAPQKLDFTVQGNGQEETVAIPVSSMSSWSGIISRVWFNLHTDAQANTGQYCIPAHIGKTNA